MEFERKKLLAKLDSPQVVDFLQEKVGIDVTTVRNDVKIAKVQMYFQTSQGKNGQPEVNTDLFPRGEYYLNR